MGQELLIGCRGWDYDAWVPDFYPPDLPAAWRFCYYSNQHRSVLVPARQLAGADLDRVTGWREDCDDGFRFVFELTSALLEPSPLQAWQKWRQILAPVKELTAGFLITGPEAQSLYQPAREDFPGARLWWDPPDGVARSEPGPGPTWGGVWRPQREARPARPDAPVLALTGELDLRRLRKVLESLAEIAGRTGAAALFFDDCRNGSKLSRDARFLAEMMGVL